MMKRFNIRVYAIIVYNDAVLVTDELRHGVRMTKFPGGGLEWGEGALETLKRECAEELNQEPQHCEHFYTTDFFVQSAFSQNDQMLSIYYQVELPDPEKIPVKLEQYDFNEATEGAQIFRWIPLCNMSSDSVTFPIDKVVAGMLSDLHSK